ncbi:membrane protease subunit, stomatin/prohibitin [Pseudomonas asplenii]|uniref:Membrane protease subunit, stomatin/prohibitin n=1 Tax=Pseudomonas asplenii TaxID=53407 RepID=A0A0M9GFE7_9PSED|nr:protease modulator HflK [Pseudomonas fuscovaginae]KPA89824.1 membrane protease subunit, stomatin/prohibitin [Pseudomonas fuscovaginae]
MRVDLEASQADLESLPRFQRAGLQARQLQRLGLGLAVLALSGLVLGFFVGLFAPASIWPSLLNNNAVALLVLVAALQSAAGVARWREQARAPAVVEPGVASALQVAEALGAYERLLARLDSLWRNALAQIGATTLWLGGWALLALVSVEQTWNLTLAGASLGLSGSVAASLGLLLAFALLVLERQLAQAHAAEWPEAEALAQFVRVAIGVQVVSALCLLFSGPQNLWPARLLSLIGLLPALVAAELLLRALLSLFSPRRDSLEPRLVATSFIAGLLRWPPQPLLALQDELHNRFGIDLRQIWAFSYMRRAFAPVLLVVLAVGWLLSGVSEVPLQGRGIYERFGKPVDVFGPGLHVGLPWPLGRVLAVENGVVHELATSVEAAASAVPDPAEDEAPASANRLWDASHVNEKSQVIASSSGDRQGFQVVNMDVRFVYRIGLSDQAALAATYNSADVPSLIRSTASRVLVHDFAARTLDGLLGEQRTALAEDIGRAVQADLQRLDSGVEILATVVEAIHPPAGAANAYHAVQAAQISAQALISRERGAASEQANQAQLQASIVEDQARASAHEVQAGARAADLRFSAERQAYAQAGQAFVLEQYLAQLSQGLGKAKLWLLDHRLGGNSAPTIDLRSFTLPADPMPARKAVQPGVTP